jgi:tetratricopeptide (TPR) repeat protein
MRKSLFILAILVFAVLYYMGVMTEKETLPFSREFFTVETPSTVDLPLDVKALWPLKGKAGGQKISSLTNKELDQLYQLKLDRGIRNLPMLSFFLIRQAEQARNERDHELSLRLSTYSIKFSPELSQPYFELARTLWAQNPFQFTSILSSFFDGVKVLIAYYSSSLNVSYNLFYILANAILLTFALFGIVVLIKYLPLYFYDIHKDLTQEVSKVIFNSFKIFLLFIPFFLRMDLLWAILYWTILLWGYVPKKERQLLLLFLVLLVYLPYSLRFSSSFLDSPSSDILLEVNKVNYEDWDGEDRQRLEAWVTTHPEDADALFTLGLMEKRQGRYDRAEKFYQSAIMKDPSFSEAYSNLGNVYLARKEQELAISSYEKAIAINPSKAAYHFNLYRAYSQKTFLSGKTDQTFQRARRLDPKLVDSYLTLDTSKQNPTMNRWLVDETVSSERLWKRVRVYFMGGEGVLFHLFKAWFEKVPSKIPFLLPLFYLVFLAGMSRYSRSKRFMTRCPLCGSPTYRFYLEASIQNFVCFNCYRIFVQKEELHPRIVEKKGLQVQQFQKERHLIGRFVSHFLVGFAYLWQGSFVKGLLLTTLFFIFVMKFVYWNGVIVLSWVRWSPSVWKWVFWGGLSVLFYSLCLRQVYRLKPRFERRTKSL